MIIESIEMDIGSKVRTTITPGLMEILEFSKKQLITLLLLLICIFAPSNILLNIK